MTDILKEITTAKIYPAIGIARVGNSPAGFFIGPERVGETSSPEGGYKDAQGRMKRAARFRIWGDACDTCRRLQKTSPHLIHLANKKAA
jgi:hypothetical protein